MQQPSTSFEAWKWLGDDSLFLHHQDVAERCLEWMDCYGDIDGDGLQEYQTRSPQGYENMGWKDAGDSVIYPDGPKSAEQKRFANCKDTRMMRGSAWPTLSNTLGGVKLPKGSRFAAEIRTAFLVREDPDSMFTLSIETKDR